MRFYYPKSNLTLSNKLITIFENKVTDIIHSDFIDVEPYISTIEIVTAFATISSEIVGAKQYIFMNRETKTISFTIQLSYDTIPLIQIDYDTFHIRLVHELYHCRDQLHLYNIIESFDSFFALQKDDLWYNNLHHKMATSAHLWSEYYAFRNAGIDKHTIILPLEKSLKDFKNHIEPLKHHSINELGAMSYKDFYESIFRTKLFYDLYNIIEYIAYHDHLNTQVVFNDISPEEKDWIHILQLFLRHMFINIHNPIEFRRLLQALPDIIFKLFIINNVTKFFEG